MVEFKTLKSDEIKFGDFNFIEIARKKAVSERGEKEFISLSRGIYTLNKEKRYQKSFTIPLSEEVVDFISKKIKEML